MKKKSVSNSAFFNVRVLVFAALLTSSAAAALFAVSVNGARRVEKNRSGSYFVTATLIMYKI